MDSEAGHKLIFKKEKNQVILKIYFLTNMEANP